MPNNSEEETWDFRCTMKDDFGLKLLLKEERQTRQLEARGSCCSGAGEPGNG